MNVDDAMVVALAEARLAEESGDVPVGAVVLRNGEIIGRGHNQREINQDPLAHAEVLAIREACATTGEWRLTDATLVVTLEPCVMCAGAILAARIPTVVFGALDPKAGAAGSLYNVLVDPRLNHEAEVRSGLMAAESSALLRGFFASKREPPTEL